MDVKAQLDELQKNSDQQWERYRQLLPQSDDVELVVLKGHLIIEELLYAVVQEHCANPDAVIKAKLSFAQLVYLAQALVKLPTDATWWKSISLLNAIRNSLVHSLEPKQLESRLNDLNSSCRVPDELLQENYAVSSKPAKIAARCICFIIGQLSVIGIVSAFIERNLRMPKD